MGPSVISPVPPEIERLYHETEDCLNSKGDFDRVTWIEAESINQGRFNGYWTGHTIYLDNWVTAALPMWEAQRVIRHESIHEILQISGHGDPRWRCQYGPGGLDN